MVNILEWYLLLRKRILRCKTQTLLWILWSSQNMAVFPRSAETSQNKMYSWREGGERENTPQLSLELTFSRLKHPS